MAEKEQQFEVRDMRRKQKFMLDDDYINGYAKKLDPYATAVYTSLCRHADKEQKTFPSVETIAEQHNIGKRTVTRKLETLVEHNLIKKVKQRKEDGTFGRNIYYLLDKTEWKDHQVPERQVDNDQVPENTSPSATDDNSQLYKKDSHKKDTHSMDSDESTITGEEVNEIIGLFESVNPTYEKLFNMKTQRKAVKELIDKFGYEEVKHLVEALEQIEGEKYAPTITTPHQLQSKMGKLKSFFERRKKEQDKVAFIN